MSMSSSPAKWDLNYAGLGYAATLDMTKAEQMTSMGHLEWLRRPV